MKSKAYRMVESSCPQCSYTLTGATIAHGKDERPKPGDTIICLNCGQLGAYLADLTIQKATAEQIRELMKDAEAWALVEKAQLFIQRRGRLR